MDFFKSNIGNKIRANHWHYNCWIIPKTVKYTASIVTLTGTLMTYDKHIVKNYTISETNNSNNWTVLEILKKINNSYLPDFL